MEMDLKWPRNGSKMVQRSPQNAKHVREIASRLFKQNLKLIFEYLKHGLKNTIKMT